MTYKSDYASDMLPYKLMAAQQITQDMSRPLLQQDAARSDVDDASKMLAEVGNAKTVPEIRTMKKSRRDGKR